jgi:Protein of unknown function (DUF4058)
MPSPFPGMDPFLEQNPIFQELHTQMLAEAQAQLQPQLRPKYIARLERHLSEGGIWELEVGVTSLAGKEPDLTIAGGSPEQTSQGSTAVLATPTASAPQELQPEELALRKQRRIVIYVQSRPRVAVAAIELLSPSNKAAGSSTQARYLEKRSSALHGGLHWVEIDLLRGGQRPSIAVPLPKVFDYLAYVAQARLTGWNHLAYAWTLHDSLPGLPIPLLGSDQVMLDLATCFRVAYDRIAADDEVDYHVDPPPPALSSEDQLWMNDLLRQHGMRP